MSIVEYNVRIIVGFIIVLLGCVWMVFDAKKIENIWVRVLLIVIVVIIAAAIISSLFLQIAYQDKTIAEGEVVGISTTGSLAGLLDSYTVDIKTNEGEIVSCYTSIFLSKKFESKISAVSVGDTVAVKGTDTFWNMMYDIVTSDSE